MEGFAASSRLPTAYWAHFTQAIAPLADEWSGGHPVREIEVTIEFRDASVFHIGPALQDLDRWFRWAHAVDQVHRSGPAKPPLVHLLQPALPKDFTFEIVSVEGGSLWVRLRSALRNIRVDLSSVVLVLALWNDLTGIAPFEFLFDGGPDRVVAPAAPADVMEQQRGLFGIREGGHTPHSDAADFRIALDGDRVLTCNVRVPSRLIDSDSEFIKDAADACAQFADDDEE
ncbi:hypothetical protein ABT147_19880 [Streptomyces sp. NPDC001868]|uniref:hypothetical protein n=1 Tax=Streptomyces sp. NPDC001868 TaxID=3154401 RepID=UPI00331C4878